MTHKLKNRSGSKRIAVYDKLSLYLIIFSMSIIPLLVRVITFDYPMSQFEWYINQVKFFDVFSKVKADAIILAGIVSLGMIIFYYTKVKSFKQEIDPINKTLMGYGGIIIASTVFTISTYVSLHGFLERYEGVYVLISYLLIFYVCRLIDFQKKMLNKIMIAFMVSNFILSIIGIFQYLGKDIIFNENMKPLIVSQALKGLNFNLSKSFNYTAIFQTLYHSNYVGLYIALSLPIFMTLFIYVKHKRLKSLYFLLILMVLFNLIGSISRGGIIGILIGFPVFILLNHRIIFKYKMSIAILFFVIAIVGIGFEIFTDGFMSSRFKQIFSETHYVSKLEGIEVERNNIRVDYQGDRFLVEIVSHVNQDWKINYFFNDLPLKPSGINDRGHISFEGDAKDFEVYLVESNSEYVLAIDIDKTPWLFGYENEALKYKNIYGNYTEIVTPKTFGFSGMEKLGSGRGYIWSRTIPKILERPLLGYGPDTFALAFPQNDYVGKYGAYGTTNMLVDKPHNMYLQIAISTGIPSLILFLWLMGLNFKGVFKIYKRKNHMLDYNQDYKQILLHGFTVSLFSYLIASFFADSNVNVSVVFWVILGLSFSLQKQIERDEE